jgi:hypothetical protein
MKLLRPVGSQLPLQQKHPPNPDTPHLRDSPKSSQPSGGYARPVSGQAGCSSVTIWSDRRWLLMAAALIGAA